MTPRFMLLEDAARTLAVDPVWLDSKCRLSKVLITKHPEDRRVVNFIDTARALGLTPSLAELVATGKEWLLTGKQVLATYGHDEVTREKISGGALYETPEGKVYQASSFIKWLLLDAREQRLRLEGKKKPHGKVHGKGLRR